MNKIILVVLMLTLMSCKTLDVGGPGCPVPDFNDHPVDEFKVYSRALQLMGNDEALCGKINLTIEYYDVGKIPACDPGDRGCFRYYAFDDRYEIHIRTNAPWKGPSAILLHEFGHVLMHRSGWPTSTHHERMRRMGFD